jgi:hypothetical protein
MAALAILGLAVSSRGPEALAAEAREATMPGDGFAWRLFFTSDTRGYIYPCGCAEGQLGGLLRRATYLAKARKPGDLNLDLGNLIEGTRGHERPTAEPVRAPIRDSRVERVSGGRTWRG